ncbi:hypothetical protein PHYSODRAFT_294793 [Phytophthora sojae]|uniref:RxLR effector protein n=1 Tax=Phytophthora sojae (strain P6497) TaxID=1094619 RepID=G4YL47_PHYSP|nr:hypothetical protein PHYSODRAFT_294793 [Phytophthora sojae]EGZ29802.1 hypothetical protein PHYSODRAFT_294793 [Phytophthora sojae]|eukprot:XP_009517077.1 hypothetical protein PHYSODRAFT_294793 [Phytophthora sojae]
MNFTVKQGTQSTVFILTQASERLLAAAQANIVAQRSLRSHDPLSDKEESEERGLGSKLKELKLWWMLKRGMNSKQYAKAIGLKSLKQNANWDPKLETLVKYAASYGKKN